DDATVEKEPYSSPNASVNAIRQSMSRLYSYNSLDTLPGQSMATAYANLFIAIASSMSIFLPLDYAGKAWWVWFQVGSSRQAPLMASRLACAIVVMPSGEYPS